MRNLTSVTKALGLAAVLAAAGCGGEPPRVPFPTAGTTPSVTAPAVPGTVQVLRDAQ